jgi:hypothetical protein
MFRHAVFSVTLFAFVLVGASDTMAQNESAQNVLKGIRLGYGMASLSGEDVSGVSPRSGVSGGLFVRTDFNRNFGIQGELNIMLKGAANDFTVAFNDYETIELNYIQVPILLRAALPVSDDFVPALYAGPSVSVSVGNTFTAAEGADNNLFTEDVHHFQYEATVGAGVQYKRLLLDARYDIGLVNAFVFSDAKNRFFSVSLGYLF